MDFVLSHFRFSRKTNSSIRRKGQIRTSVTRLLSSPGGTKKGKIIVVFLGLTSFRRVWFRPENGTFLQILGVPTGEKTRRNEENTPKRRLFEVGH